MRGFREKLENHRLNFANQHFPGSASTQLRAFVLKKSAKRPYEGLVSDRAVQRKSV
jgi:hypothetical protein